MNLIMSDVEETIMIVDPESVLNGHSVINVDSKVLCVLMLAHDHCRLQNGRWRCFLYGETVSFL